MYYLRRTLTLYLLEPEVTIFIIDSRDGLVFAHERARRLRDEAAADRLRRAPRTQRSLSASLRGLACHIDSAPLAHRPA